ncbi:MAG: hypothetical protein M3O20_07360 [Acidobacteriota bacterium]|nr:hypothetical protein [Acidobacteriota bacterium]
MFIENPLNTSPWTFPILEVLHISSFATAIGTVALVDFRLLGLGLRAQTAGQLTKDTRGATLIALSLALFSGLLLYATDPDKFYLNVSFLFKITCLLLAIVFHYTIHRKVVLGNPSPGLGKLVAMVSIALWVGVVFGGIFIEFVKPGLSFE